MATDTRNQHFVPKTYLENFSIEKADKTARFFINRMLKEATTEKEIQELPTQVVCIANDAYTLEGETAEERMMIEWFYRDAYETNYKSIYNILTDTNKHEITEDERKLIISTVISMLFRTQKIPQMHVDLMNRTLEGVYQMCQEVGKDFFFMGDTKIELKGRSLEQLQKDYIKESKPQIAIMQLRTALMLIKHRVKADSIYVYTLEEGEYITSDNPVIHHNPFHDSHAPFDIDNVLSLPINSKQLLMLFPAGVPEGRLYIFRQNKKGTLAVSSKLTSNYQQLISSNVYLLGTASGLKGYLATKEQTEKPMTDEEYNKATVAKPSSDN